MIVSILPKIHRIRICKNKFNFLYPQRSLNGVIPMFCVRFKTSGEDNEKTDFGDSFCCSGNVSFRGRCE